MSDLYLIGDGRGHELSPETAGAKAANLSRMAAMGLLVPPAFVVPTSLCEAINSGDPEAGRRLDGALAEGIDFLERVLGRRFGDRRKPLLVSVRSGAARSMPGMLETVLDIGCTDEAIAGLVRQTGNARFAWDCRRRFLEGYAEVVLGLDPRAFATALSRIVAAECAASERDLDSEALARVVDDYEGLIGSTHDALEQTGMQQLQAAARAVFASWNSDKAKTYRRLQGLEDLAGTAVTVQAMVFGNADTQSGAGVAFSRDPSTGAKTKIIELLFEAQGEDVVSGRRTPMTGGVLAADHADLARELGEVLERLEAEFQDAQDVEFTIEQGKLWLLQTRSAKRTPRAALRIAIDLVNEQIIEPAEALARLGDIDLAALRITHFDNAPAPLARGLSAAPGVATGRAAFDSDRAVAFADGGEPVILMRPDTTTADVAGFSVCAGIVTSSGGRTAHAALIARQLSRPCVVGCADLHIDVEQRRARLADRILKEGDWVSVDGDQGLIYLGHLDVASTLPEQDLATWRSWKATQS